MQCRGRHPATPEREPRPPQPVHLLGAQGEIQTATQDIAVDQHGVASRFHDRNRDGGREYRCPSAAAATEHRQHSSRIGRRLDRIGQRAHQPGFAVWQHRHMLGTDRDRRPPHIRVAARRDDHYTVSAG